MEFGTILLIMAALGAFFMAFNNGANDVANSFASAVGAKAISMKQAVLIAGIMNLLGAVMLGGYVSSKLITGVVDPAQFGDPKAYMLAMFAVLIAAGVFVLTATLFSMPVSSSHSIVGSLIGASVMAGGWSAVNWGELRNIVLSWFVSPILAAVLAAGLLSYIKSFIVKNGKEGMIARLQYFLPFVLATTVGFFALILMKGSSLKALKPDSFWEYLLFLGVVIPYGTIVSQALLRSLTGKMKDTSESIEKIFKNLQVGTSSYVAFAHGANDVANSIAPVFAIFLVVTHSGLPTKEILQDAHVPLWILILGGIGIAVGIGLLGHRVIETLSKKITTLNNTRGFSVDFSAASTVVIASLLGYPVSSTHAATGAIVGSGLRDGEKVKGKVLLKIFAMWVLTVPAAALITMAIYWLLAAFIL
ncbi:MAG: inorganic phosphate transporter [Planctomycetota bacterium]|nr:inorganic phosphate transporter [Planctomycetota bacterium]